MKSERGSRKVEVLPEPFFDDGQVSIYCGDMREIVPLLGKFDAVITDPPYEETSLKWDRWPEGWPSLLVDHAPQIWCFGSMRMFWEKSGEFKDWHLAQDIVWEKHNGSSLHSDRFRRVHENAVHLYRGDWSTIYKSPPIVAVDETRKRKAVTRRKKPAHFGGIGKAAYEYAGTRIMRSVIAVKSCHGYAEHPTQKPEGIIWPLMKYSVPGGGGRAGSVPWKRYDPSSCQRSRASCGGNRSGSRELSNCRRAFGARRAQLP